MLNRRLVIVGGKGGVGRSTVSAALGLAAARRGLVTLIAEVAGQSDVPGLLEASGGGSLVEVELAPGLHHVAVERRAALTEYLRDEVPGPVSAAVLARSRLFELFVDAAPGMSELLTIGKVSELVRRPRHRPEARQYDLVILDAPASGQLVGLLGAPETFGSIARTGPVARQAEAIHAHLRDPGLTGYLAVLTPEQMPVSETVSLDRALAGVLGRGLDGVVINRLLPQRFSAEEAETLAGAGDDPPVRSARWFHARAGAQQSQLSRLAVELAEVRALASLPFVFTERFGRGDVEVLADHLEAAWTG